MVQHNSRFCYNFSCYSLHPLLFSDCKSSIVTSRRIESMIDRQPLACLPACLLIQTHIEKAMFQFTIKWMHDNTTRAPKAPKQSQGHHSPFAAGIKSFACLPDLLVHSFFRGSLCPVVRPGPANQLRNKRQASIIKHFAMH